MDITAEVLIEVTTEITIEVLAEAASRLEYCLQI
jgi:hypothetical protein